GGGQADRDAAPPARRPEGQGGERPPEVEPDPVGHYWWPETRCAPAPFRPPLPIPASRKAGMLAPAFGSGEDETIGVAPGRLVGRRVPDRLTARRKVRALDRGRWLARQ